MHASLAQNSEKQTAKIHSPASSLSLAGSRPCTFYTKHTQNAKNQLSLAGWPVTPVYSTLHQGHSSLWVGGRAECEPRATPLSTRSILAVCRVNRLPLFPFSFVPHGRPPPFPTVRDIRTFLLLFFVSPIVTQEKHVFQKLWCGRRIFPPYPPLGTYFEEKVCC